ncbi:P-loop containing nucleoside triphosphate hydrolase protein [Polyplosphaeria fusca]|uniref:ATP-dependent RNA helicase n=1 Tax=Polyplosphaeria fusca TaxID=682080 RepID=A0A9P4R9W0_9PLEO|nr:P-loop containing nucleoside triphosphate hydrolase protein [Polyplosphaeria fusca]
MPALYARWAPSKPAVAPKPSGPASPPPIDSPASTSLPKKSHHTPEKEFRTKSRTKSKKKANKAQSPEDGPLDGDSDIADSTVQTVKKRKRDVQSDKPHNSDDEATPKKHKTILSKFERASKLGEKLREDAKVQRGSGEPDAEEERERLHDLVPLPQPEPVLDVPFEPTYSALPKWLAQPTTIDSATTIPFAKLGVHPTFVTKLEKQGYKTALAVQTALLPMLHPGPQQHLGDMCVSARTGSGKTLAYMLPVVEALKDRVVSSLSAIVVVPTRQLVEQALKVAEELCTGTKVKVGTAVGNVAFQVEQKQLVRVIPRYDKQRAEELQIRATQSAQSGFVNQRGFTIDLAKMPDHHVPEYHSTIDILICTPGRLVEHIKNTPGFLLRDVNWLVIDEADQLLNQEFQGWSTVLMDELHGETPEDFMNARELICKQRQGTEWSVRKPAHRCVTKVVLSATMKKDLTKLGNLRFTRPKLVVIEDEAGDDPLALGEDDAYELPSTLEEFAVPVGNGSEKPLYLLHVLLSQVFADDGSSGPGKTDRRILKNSRSSDGSSSESSEQSSAESSSEDESTESSILGSKNRVLIFAKSNENASRLSHLLSALHPPLKPYLKTLTRSVSSQKSKKLLESLGRGKIKILIASDLASRGLDIADLTHVINYDVPPSLVSYVHRVGRTARAGKKGQAWTLFTKTEAAWFWKQLAKGEVIKRGGKKVKRIKFDYSDVTEGKRETYETALEDLQGAVEGTEA